MKTGDVKKAAWKGAFSNYGRMGLRVVLGLITFRLLYQGLNQGEFGFWSLLWSVFGYGILVDFGFGSAAQKRVAESLANKDWDQLSCALSTIFYFYVGAAILIGFLGWWMAGTLLGWLGGSSEQQVLYLPATRAFFVGMALGFPMGIFPEVLRGLQKLEIANRIAMIGLLANAALIAIAIWLQWSLVTLFIIALSCVLVPDMLAGWVALRSMPGVKLRPSLFSRHQLLSTSKFSLRVWASMMSHLMRNKTDQLVVGMVISLPAVALLQASGKVAEMFGMVTKQVSEALSPAAAYLHADGRQAALHDIFVKGLRITIIVATPLYVGTAVNLDFLVWLLTGDKAPPSSTLLVGQVLLFWFYHLALTHLVFRRMFMMCGQERRLMWQGLAEAFLNVALSLGFTLWLRTIVGVALGSLIPTVIFGWTVLWPWAAKEVKMGKWLLFRRTALRPMVACLPMAAVGISFRWLAGSIYGHPEWMISLATIALMAIAAVIGMWSWALDSQDRAHLVDVIRAGLKKIVKSKTRRPV